MEITEEKTLFGKKYKKSKNNLFCWLCALFCLLSINILLLVKMFMEIALMCE